MIYVLVILLILFLIFEIFFITFVSFVNIPSPLKFTIFSSIEINSFINTENYIYICRSAILGFDVDTNEITIGMALPIWADLDISLDGDG